jgi:phosphate-selective porin
MIIATLILILQASPNSLTLPTSFHYGKIFRADFHFAVNAGVNAVQNNTDFGTARIGVEGKFFKHYQYEVEFDFASSHHWKDVFLNLDHIDDAQTKVGKFKLPFCMDELTPRRDVDFVDRTFIARHLAPGRDIGVMLHGRLLKKVLSYQAGAFLHDGENSESKTEVRGHPAYAMRVAADPKNLHFGAAVVTSNVPEGLNSLKGEDPTRVFVEGTRLRFGTEFKWEPGPFSFKSEWVRVREAREGQSIRETNLPAKISTGWYLTSMWRINKPFQLGARYEQDRFSSADPRGIPFASPRAPTLPNVTQNIWTGGVNWFVLPFAKIQVNGVKNGSWAAEARFQFFM